MAWRPRWRWFLPLGAVALVGLAVGLGWRWLHSATGEAALRRQLVEIVHGAIQGKLAVSRVVLDGAHVHLEGIELFAPEGELVARLDVLDATLRWTQLARRRIVLDGVTLDGLAVRLDLDDRGLGLGRALAQRAPAAPMAGSATSVSAFTIVVEALSLRRGQLAFRSGKTALSAVELTAHGSASVDLGTLGVGGALVMAGRTQGVLEGPIGLSVTSDTAGGATRAHVVLTVPRSSLDGTLDVGAREVVVEQLVAAPETLVAFFPWWPLRVPVSAMGTLHLDRAVLSLHAGAAVAEVSGAFDLSTPALGQLELRASLPGLSVEVKGDGSTRDLALEGTVASTDLALFRASEIDLLGLPLPPLGGGAALQLTVTGPLLHPALKAKGQLTQARIGVAAVQKADVALELPDVTSPLDAMLDVHASRLIVAEREFDEILLAVSTHGRALEARLKTKGLGDLEVRGAGELDVGEAGATVSALSVTADELAWTLDGASHVAWGPGPGRFELTPLTLRDGLQRLMVSGRLQGKRVTANVEAERVDLARLPRALALEGLGLRGVASLSAAIDGNLPWLAGRLTATWSHGALSSMTEIDAAADATWKGKRLSGSARATSSLGKAELTVDLPFLAPFERRDEPLSARLVVSEVSTARIQPLVGGSLPAEAVVALDARLSGTSAQPSLEATLDAADLQVTTLGRVVKAENARLGVRTLESHHLRLESSLAVFDGTAALGCEAPWTVGELLRRLPTVSEATQARFDCELEVSRVDVSALAPGWELTGRLGAKGHFAGVATRPMGELELSLTGASSRWMTALEAVARLEAGADSSTLTGSVKAAGTSLLAVDARVEAQVAELGALESLGDRNVSSTITLLPFELSQVFTATQGRSQPGGLASGTVKVQGTLFAPTVLATATVEALRFGQVALGAAHLELESDGTRESLVLTLSGASGEGSHPNALKLAGWLELPLSAKGGFRSLDWQTAPMSLELESDRLDLAFLSDIHPAVRLVGGRLSVRGTASGSLGKPQLEGDVSWKDGRLALYGYGDYRDIELLAHATDTSVTLEKLGVRSGAGVATLGLAAHRQEASWHLTGSGSLDRFPIVADDQLVGAATLKISFTGSANAGLGLVSLDPVDIPRAEFELPEVKGKNLQGLARPADVFVKGRGSDRPRLPTTTMVDAGPSRVLRARLNAPGNLWIRGTDLNLELGLSEGFTLTQTDATPSDTAQSDVTQSDTTQLSGVATVKRGTISVIGRKFTVGRRPDDTGDEKASELRFNGSPITPDVSVTAVHVNEKEKVRVIVAVIGRGSDVSVTTTSEPPMSESDISTLIATGRRELRRGSSAAMTPEDAVSVVGQIAAAQLKTALAKKLPIDVLSFEASENLQKLKFDVGKYLSDALYLGVSAQAGANPAQGENPWAGRLEYRLTRRLSLEAYGGTAPAAGLDLVWSREY